MHKSCGYCYVIVRMDSLLNYEVVSHDLYRGSDALEKFVERIEGELLNIQTDLSAPAEMIMAPGDLKAYNDATECWICKEPFLKPAPEVLQKLKEAKYRLLEVKEWETCMEKEHPEKKKVQRAYKEALGRLNQKLRIGSFKTKVPLICHNFWGYDSHPLMKVVSKFTADKLNCIPENIGKYKAMDVGQLRFLDSFQHMGMGLDKLVKCLGGKIEKFPLTVNKEDYKHAQELANVFMNYTIMCLQDNGLDPSHYVFASGMFNDSLYKSSGAELKLMTDMNEYLTVEKEIRGGMTMACHRYANTNNLKCSDYDSSKLKSWIMYEDMNALYSGAMTQYMPTKILGKVDLEEVPDIQSIAPDADIGYILEVDLEVPVHLHNYFADYPLAPKKQIVPENWLSPYNAKLVQDKEVEGGKYVTGEKLVQTFYPKKNYVVHYRALQLYMRQGLKVTKIHSALKFKQSPWMKEYM
ncbi:hypothetical protein RclHR1_17490003 [Rhizophagus clarus]|uniref:DNA-directed DNA polymerase n=1 Tax=Rhizophagus clarus TaxID=94130 RepID=A0A2Z6QK60_9GLOM|nr:hypothetical protein RclHR1_17490003 [Rhizophagus clarus]